jgi:hypothetical protein
MRGESVHIWETNAGKTFQEIGDVNPVDGRFTVTLDPDSLYTLTTTAGQEKGTAQPPVNTRFPFPYADDFEQTPDGKTAKYLADQDGAFEAHPCHDRSGKCLEQVIERKPIPWGPLPDPFTMAGDASWSDYTLSADLLFGSGSEVSLIGRIDSADVFADANARWPSAYVFQLRRDGAWALLDSRYKRAPHTLASGVIEFRAQDWHALQVVFEGQKIIPSLDGKQLTAVQDPSHTAGMIAIGTDWGTAQFDNLSVR